MKKLILISALLFSFNGWAEEYVNSASWGSSSDMAMFTSNSLGVMRYTPEVSTNVRSASIGDLIIVKNQNGDEVKRFNVRVIAMQKENRMCFISWLNNKQPKEFLSIKRCK